MIGGRMSGKRKPKHARLMLMRHAKADRSDPAAVDFERPLTDRGRKAVGPMAKWLRREGFKPGLILSSPATRAGDTALRLAGKLGMQDSAVAWDERIYDADLKTLLEVIRGRAETDLLLVGHNPGFDDLLGHLCSEPAPRDEEGKLLTTAAIAVLEFAGSIDTRAGSARLVALKRPKDRD
jgi:phosphohistidine phosphatase